MISVAVCDSEAKGRNELLHGCQLAQQRLHLPICCQCYASGEELLEGMSPETDIILMNTRLTGMDGLETARRVRENNTAVVLIFVTDRLSDAAEAFRVRAFDFIPRPMDIQRFGWALTMAIQMLERERGDYVTFHTPSQWVRIPMHSILYVESGRNKAIVHTVISSYELYITMKDVEERLDRTRFFRCHSSYIINLTNIVRVDGLRVELIDGSMVSVSKHRKKEFLDRLPNISGQNLS